jgi:hypothetical protein
MFPYADPRTRLDQHHERVAEMVKRAAEHKLARDLSQGRHRRFGRWPRRRPEGQAAQVTLPA